MSPDYEAEYNNRARVPEHPAIVAGWARDAAAYRDEVGSRFLRVPYGPSDRQAIDLFRPETKQVQTVVVFVHGGYWQAMDRSSFSHLARGLNAQGITVALPGYDLCPEVRVGEIVAQIREACRALATESPRLVVAGHSAGGHLAACMLATDWTKLDATLPHDFVQAAYAISGLFELKPLVSTSINKALELSEVEAERLSPLLWDAPRGLTLDAVVGGDESEEYLRQSRSIVERWGEAGVRTRYEAIAGANHFTVVAPLADPASSMTARLAGLARGA